MTKRCGRSLAIPAVFGKVAGESGRSLWGASSVTPLRRDLDAWQLPNLARKTKTVLRPRRLLAVVAIYNAAARGACQVTGVDFKGLNSQSTFPKRVVPGRR